MMKSRDTTCMIMLQHKRHQEEPPLMKTIPELLGGAQILLSISYDI